MSILTTLQDIASALTNLNETLQGMTAGNDIIAAINAVEDAIGGNWNPDNSRNFEITVTCATGTTNWITVIDIERALGLDTGLTIPVYYIDSVSRPAVPEYTQMTFYYETGQATSGSSESPIFNPFPAWGMTRSPNTATVIGSTLVLNSPITLTIKGRIL